MWHHTETHHVDRMTEASKNITLPQTSFAVIREAEYQNWLGLFSVFRHESQTYGKDG